MAVEDFSPSSLLHFCWWNKKVLQYHAGWQWESPGRKCFQVERVACLLQDLITSSTWGQIRKEGNTDSQRSFIVSVLACSPRSAGSFIWGRKSPYLISLYLYSWICPSIWACYEILKEACNSFNLIALPAWQPQCSALQPQCRRERWFRLDPPISRDLSAGLPFQSPGG